MSQKVEMPVTAVQVALKCDCGCEMWPTGVVLTSFPEQYPHRCSGCGRVENHLSRYPRVEHRTEA